MSLHLRNRGKESNDDRIFGKKWLPILKEAVTDMSHLLTRGYSERSSLQLVGNRYKLNSRQRKAVFRMSSSEMDVFVRQNKCCLKEDLRNTEVDIDGFNVLILLECALSGAFVFKCKDGTFRDISSVHGSYKRVIKTEEAIILAGRVLNELGTNCVNWFLDAPVSNSGRLKKRIENIGKENGYKWTVRLENSPDYLLADSGNIVISSDGWILNRCKSWFNLSALIIEEIVTSANIIEV